MWKNFDIYGVLLSKTEEKQECCLAPSKSFKKNIISVFQKVQEVDSPVDCIIVRNVESQPDVVFELLDLCPLVPTGSVWISTHPGRSSLGDIDNYPEVLSKCLCDRGLYLADKVYWNVFKPKSDSVLTSNRRNKHWLSLASVCLRFTKCDPASCWFETDHDLTSIWNRSADENYGWYARQIALTCPSSGTVLDLYCGNRYVAEAAAKMNRKFIGITEDIEKVKTYLSDVENIYNKEV